LEWEVFSSQAAFRRIILVRIYQFSSFSIPSRTASCGIVVVNFPNLTGSQILAGSLVGSLLLMAGGIGLRTKAPGHRKSQQRKTTHGMIFLGAVIIIGIALSLLGSWLLSVLMVVFAVIVIIGIFSFLS
jgi:hypothetical protein